MERDGRCCRICGTGAWLQVHHVDPRRSDERALIVLCSTCHKKLVHRGDVVITGEGPGFVIRLRDGSPLPILEGLRGTPGVT